MRFTRRPAALAALIIHSRIVPLFGISSYSDGYLPTCPNFQACCIITSKLTHDIRIAIFYATVVIVLLVEAKEEVFFIKEVGHVIVE